MEQMAQIALVSFMFINTFGKPETIGGWAGLQASIINERCLPPGEEAQVSEMADIHNRLARGPHQGGMMNGAACFLIYFTHHINGLKKSKSDMQPAPGHPTLWTEIIRI